MRGDLIPGSSVSLRFSLKKGERVGRSTKNITPIGGSFEWGENGGSWGLEAKGRGRIAGGRGGGKKVRRKKKKSNEKTGGGGETKRRFEGRSIKLKTPEKKRGVWFPIGKCRRLRQPGKQQPFGYH